jgi:hypothetical protein
MPAPPDDGRAAAARTRPSTYRFCDSARETASGVMLDRAAFVAVVGRVRVALAGRADAGRCLGAPSDRYDASAGGGELGGGARCSGTSAEWADACGRPDAGRLPEEPGRPPAGAVVGRERGDVGDAGRAPEP